MGLDVEFGRNGRGAAAPLIMGSIYGHRAFFLKPMSNRLVSPVLTVHVWDSGVQDSACIAHQWNWPYLSSKPRDEDHSMLDCSCGFYAYYRRQRNRFAKRDTYRFFVPVIGIIEGTGETVVGTKGFRSKKARLVAVAPKKFGMFRPGVIRSLQEAVPGVPVYRSKRAMYRAFPLSRAKEFMEAR